MVCHLRIRVGFEYIHFAPDPAVPRDGLEPAFAVVSFDWEQKRTPDRLAKISVMFLLRCERVRIPVYPLPNTEDALDYVVPVFMRRSFAVRCELDFGPPHLEIPRDLGPIGPPTPHGCPKFYTH
jgi:hypothetical protein